MEFPKDILVIDFEGFVEPAQIGAVLLDKETLKEKDNYVSYIYADLEGKNAGLRRSGITQKMLKDAPTQAEVARDVYEKFSTDITLASWVDTLDVNHFMKIMSQIERGWEDYDYHVFDIWPVAYLHLLKQGYKGSMSSEEMFEAFGLKSRGSHDALEDCRMAADVLRKIVAG